MDIRDVLQHREIGLAFQSVLADLEKLKTAVDTGKTLNDSLKATLNSLLAGLGGDYLDSTTTLAIGSDAFSVSNIAFQFHINGVEYNKAADAAGTALSGDDIPQNKYGAWAFDIAANGTITVVPATDNATGYTTAVLAAAGLPVVAADKVRMGYVTAMNSAAVFVPGTTELSTATVTEAYTSATPFSGVLPWAVTAADQTAVGVLTTTD